MTSPDRSAAGTERAERPAELRFEGRLIVLAVTGSIAAYKAVELARALTLSGADVQVLMTHTATSFVGPLTFETLTRRRVMRDPLELLPDSRIGHIVAADTADAILVAPATARWLAAMAHGLADDVITATCLASAAPVVVAPAMDGEMHAHPATVANLAALRAFGYTIVGPDTGALASGATGEGRLAEPSRILGALAGALADRPVRVPGASARPPLDPTIRPTDLAGYRVLVTAGGTAEPIDAVRFIGNRSTGKMGVAVAEAAIARGAEVTLVAGMTSVPLPQGVTLVRAETADRMRAAVLQALPAADVLVMAAAVADFRPAEIHDRKLARDGGLTLELEPTPDILADAARAVRRRWQQGTADDAADPASNGEPVRVRDAGAAPPPVLVGFAAETGSLQRAGDKLARKGVDLLVANDVSEPGSGFGTETNRVTVLAPEAAPEPWPLLPKHEVAHRLLDRVGALLAQRSARWVTGESRGEGVDSRPLGPAEADGNFRAFVGTESRTERRR